MRVARYTCDFCPAVADGPLPPDGILPPPDGWAVLIVVLADLVLDPKADGMADAASLLPSESSNLVVEQLKATMQPFETSLHVCPACRTARMGDVDAIVVERFRERDLAEEEPGDPTPLRPLE